MKFCFLSEANYPNYVRRIKEFNIKRYLELNLDIPFYISTNLPNEFKEFDGHPYIRVFDINELRKNDISSLTNETLPENPIGLYPSKYPWNLRRFILRKAAEDGHTGLFFIECDTKINQSLTKDEILKELTDLYEENTVKTSSARFVYKNRHPSQELFYYHEDYIRNLKLNFTDDQYDTLDGTNQLFFGKDTDSLIKFFNNWDFICNYGYMIPNGYKNGYLSNLSFVIPMSNFKLIHTNTPFITEHIFNDRYTSNYSEKKINNTMKIEYEISPINDIHDKTSLKFYFNKYFCEKSSNGFCELFEPLFSDISDKNPNILEIGVGTISLDPPEGMSHVPANMWAWKQKNPNYLPGNSLRSIRDFIKTGLLYGVDIQKDCKINEDRITTFIFDSRNPKKTEEFFYNVIFDIIIDDSDRDPNIRILTFNNFIKHLKDDGYYIIEGILGEDMIVNYLSFNDYKFIIQNNFIIISKKNNFDSFFFKKTELINQQLDDHIEFFKIDDESEFSINNLKFADKGFFINLRSSVDRYRLVLNQMSDFNIKGLNRFDALTDEFRQFSCTKSHLKVFENSLNHNYDIIFVAEDDFMIEKSCYHPNKGPQDFFEVIDRVYHDIQNVEWDVLLFGCNPKGPLIPITENLAVVNKSTGAWAYLIKKNAYKFLLENSNYRRDLIAIDDWLPLLNDKGFITLTTIPLSINHGVGLISTLQPSGPVNYDSWIKGSYHKFYYDLINKNENINKIQNNITIVIVGHFVENFLFYLNYLLYSMPDDLKKCKILINYDESSVDDINSKKFMLSAFFRDINHSMNTSVSYSFGGLISSIKNTIEKIKTPYFIFLEHDWVFLKKTDIDFNSLIDAFNNHNFVNAVWFSKDDNIIRGFDICDDYDGSVTPFILESRVYECNLITTCRWSNNPAMFRVSKFKNWFNNIIINEYVDTINQGSQNVEETMIPYYRYIIKKEGWNNIKDDWGTYLYGNLNEGPYVGHTDASKRYQGNSKSQPEINGEEFIKNNPL